MRVAVVVADRVVNVVEAESVESLASPVFAQVFGSAEFFDVDAVLVGPGWSRVDGEWVEPVVPEDEGE